MKNRSRHFNLLAGTLAALFLSGCATLNPGPDNEVAGVTVERVASASASIGTVSVQNQANGTRIEGEVKRRLLLGRSAILGHLDVEVLDAKGDTVYQAVHGYKRRSLKSNVAFFALEIDRPVGKGSLVRITHHAVSR